MIDWKIIKEFKAQFPKVYAFGESMWEAATEGESAYDDMKTYKYVDFEHFLLSDHEAAVLLRDSAERLEAILIGGNV
jgi:hypothetical protein